MAEERKGAKRDTFAGIAGIRGDAAPKRLIEPGPPSLPPVFLGGKATAPLRSRRRIDTPALLEGELARQRHLFARFMADLAPAVESHRLALPLMEFDWRVETAQDAREGGVPRGDGSWQRVRIPHYGGPLGRATTCYRTSFEVDEAMLSKGVLFLCFKGVDYRAHVFANGCHVGSHEGFFAPFDLEFTAVARPGRNQVVVKVQNDAIHMGNEGWGPDGHLYEGEKIYAATGPGWDDPEIGWHHCPPGMGIYQAVSVEARSTIHVRDLFVRPLPEEGRAEALVEIDNCLAVRQACRLELSVFGQNFRATVFRGRRCPLPGPLGPGTNYIVVPFSLPKHRTWDGATPWLYQAQAKLLDGHGGALDAVARQFGMRSFRIDESAAPKGRPHLNGRPIRLRGANTMGFEQQCVMRGDLDRLRDDILLARICHLNFLRLTQRPVQSEVYTLCDRLGMMTQTDLPLFGFLRKSQFAEAVRQAQEMERLVRGHPCNILVSYINEPFPDKSATTYRHLDRVELEGFFAAASAAVHQANPDRAIKPVDGDYNPPAPGLPDNHCYTCWYTGHGVDLGRLHKGFWQKVKPGWLYACGEFGTEGLDPVNTMRELYPPSWLPRSPEEERVWTPDRIIGAQTGRFHHMWFDTQHSIGEWVAYSQEHQAWATRIMTEAFRRDSRMVSFAIHLFIDAFPSGWMKSIMDVRRQPKPAYFAYREALTPLMVNLRTDRMTLFEGEEACLEAWICNDSDVAPGGLSLHYQAEAVTGVLFSRRVKAQVPADGSRFQGFIRFTMPEAAARARVTVRAGLVDGRGRVLHDTSVSLDVFPGTAAGRRRCIVIGAAGGAAAELARELGTRAIRGSPPGSDDTILVDDMGAYGKESRAVMAAVRRGANAVFLCLPPGRHRVGGDAIVVAPCGMGNRHFVSRATGHPLVDGFAPEDFRFWYDPRRGLVTPLLESSFVAPPPWTAVLKSGDGKGLGDPAWSPTLAAAEKRVGRGCLRICQLSLAGRTSTNPAARLFALRLLDLARAE